VQFKVNEFRRYYRSVRFFAVKPLTKEALKEREERSKASFIWRLIYSIDESIFMRKPPMVCEDDNHENHIAPEDKVNDTLSTFLDQHVSNLSIWFRQIITSDTKKNFRQT